MLRSALFRRRLHVIGQQGQFPQHQARPVGEEGVDLSHDVHQLDHPLEVLVDLLRVLQFPLFDFNLRPQVFDDVRIRRRRFLALDRIADFANARRYCDLLKYNNGMVGLIIFKKTLHLPLKQRERRGKNNCN